MSDPAPDAPPDVEIESIRYLSKPDGKSGTVSIVVAGVHHLFPCKRAKALYFAEGVLEAIRKQDDSNSG